MNEKKLNKSIKHFNLSKKIIPLGCQTFSKSYKLYDKKFFPLYINGGSKQFIFDLDGNKYLDLISGLGSVSIGYGINEIDNKIKKVISKGITFSLSHTIEYEVSKKLTEIIPCAEMVRFGKNGTDVNSAAVRLARYHTKREHIAICGYHGWHDWYISTTTMDGGILKDVKKYTHIFQYNNLKSLEKIFKKYKIAAVVMEPFSYELPNKNFLKNIKKLCRKNKSLLIFDEICTGFRVDLGGAQKILNVTPDLATFGKAIGNGYPISALVGKKKIMKKLENIFFSGTFGGETLSLQACFETINFLKKKNSIKKNYFKGNLLIKGFNQLSKKYGFEKNIMLEGHPTWPFLKIKNVTTNMQQKIKGLFMQEFLLKKTLFIGISFLINHSHSKSDIKRILNNSELVFEKLKKNYNNLNKVLITTPSKTLFKIRN